MLKDSTKLWAFYLVYKPICINPLQLERIFKMNLQTRIASLEAQVTQLEKEAGIMEFLFGEGVYDLDDVVSFVLSSFKKKFPMFHFAISGDAIHGADGKDEVILTFKQKSHSLDVSMLKIKQSKHNVAMMAHPQTAQFGKQGKSKDIAESIIEYFTPMIESTPKMASLNFQLRKAYAQGLDKQATFRDWLSDLFKSIMAKLIPTTYDYLKQHVKCCFPQPLKNSMVVHDHDAIKIMNPSLDVEGRLSFSHIGDNNILVELLVSEGTHSVKKYHEVLEYTDALVFGAQVVSFMQKAMK